MPRAEYQPEGPQSENSGGENGPPPGLDPIILGLLARLPKPGDVWPETQHNLWIELLKGSLKLIYKDDDKRHD